jgi:tRNA(Arg) A34 adenosine deaminase TadA
MENRKMTTVSLVSAEPAWERALELAWESFCGGTTPVGAVVTDAAGAIVTEGRGRRFETAAPPRQLACHSPTPAPTRTAAPAR